MTFDPPQWMRQRQVRTDELATGQFKATGPNLPEAVFGVRVGESLRWQAYLKNAADGPDVAATAEEFPSAAEALDAAFELYRTHIVV